MERLILTDKQRVAFALYRQRGLSQARIAAICGISRESVNRRISRARHRLNELRRLCAAREDCGMLLELLGTN